MQTQTQRAYKINKINKPNLCYSHRMMYAEIGSKRQIKEICTDLKNCTILTDEKRKQLKQSQFNFKSLFPYIFDGLNYAATHYSKEKPFPSDDNDGNYYVLKLSIDDLCHLSLQEYQTDSKEHFMHELLRFSKISDEAKYERCIQIAKGKYLLATPLKIKIRKKTQDEVSPIERKRLRNLITVDECTKIIDTIDIHILKILIDPSLGHAGVGWLPCPSALQAKINFMLHMLQDKKNKKNKKNPFNELTALFLRKYFMYINSLNRSKEIKEKVDIDAVDLWEHVSPAKVIKDEKYKNIRKCKKAEKKLTPAKKIETANRFFAEMNKKGLMAGAKVFPVGGNYNPKTKKYSISLESSLPKHDWTEPIFFTGLS